MGSFCGVLGRGLEYRGGDFVNGGFKGLYRAWWRWDGLEISI